MSLPEARADEADINERVIGSAIGPAGSAAKFTALFAKEIYAAFAKRGGAAGCSNADDSNADDSNGRRPRYKVFSLIRRFIPA